MSACLGVCDSCCQGTTFLELLKQCSGSSEEGSLVSQNRRSLRNFYSSFFRHRTGSFEVGSRYKSPLRGFYLSPARVG